MRHNIMLALAALVLVLLAFAAGRQAGIRHTVTDMEVYAVDLYVPDNPAASEWQGYDMQIYIDLDGRTYSHGLYVG